MNTNQTANLFTTLIQIALGALVSRGLITGSESESLGGALAALVVFFISHNWHSSPPANPPAAGKTAPLLVALCAASFVFSGCSSLPNTAFKAELAAATAGDAAMRGYAVYWDKAIANPGAYHRTADGLNAEKQKICDASIKLGGSIELTEALRSSYATNAALAGPLQASLTALQANAAQILATASLFLNSTNE